ncbi:MAG: imidazolonepropionase [Planctomycetota bacterium]|jgi:imidazolonepropionase
MSIIITNARILTPGRITQRGFVYAEEGVIAEVREGRPPKEIRAETYINARQQVVMPAFVDAHTHACWAGERLDEWEQKLRGATYLELLEKGGGIMSTVRATREATQEQLTESLLERLEQFLEKGTATIEIKSGYGLSTEHELKMLRAISDAADQWPGTIVPTALIAHAIDPDRPDFIETTIGETLDAVHQEFPHITIDAYCETGAWSLDDCARLFTRAIELEHPCRVHTDQFNSLGMTRWAIENAFRSVDHLEASTDEDIASLGQSETCAVALPCSGFHTDDRYASGRGLLDGGARLVIATNCNPGSAPTMSMPLTIAMATRKLGITPHEAIDACTHQAASLLDCNDRGVIERGRRADLIILRHADERLLAHDLGGNPVDAVIINGELA